MNKIILYGMAAILAIIIIVVVIVSVNEINSRRKATSFKLPSVDEIEKERQLDIFAKKREPYDFNEVQLKETEVFADDEISAEEYIHSSKTKTTLMDDFAGLMNSSGEIKESRRTQPIITSEIHLPEITQEDEANSQSNSSNDSIDVNTHSSDTDSNSVE